VLDDLIEALFEAGVDAGADRIADGVSRIWFPSDGLTLLDLSFRDADDSPGLFKSIDKIDQ
jgi:hypothetical protein